MTASSQRARAAARLPVRASSVPCPSQKSEGWSHARPRSSGLADSRPARRHWPRWNRSTPSTTTSSSMLKAKTTSRQSHRFLILVMSGAFMEGRRVWPTRILTTLFCTCWAPLFPADSRPLPTSKPGDGSSTSNVACASLRSSATSSVCCRCAVRATLTLMKMRITVSTAKIMPLGRTLLRRTPISVPLKEPGTTSRQIL
mmetsp:Transcript_79479/g.224789  ORF Transcript_79479/g.224789 Transcript_79479/m.224789 type:complete len:200 (-) Transcript_79479:614-1213(-)